MTPIITDIINRLLEPFQYLLLHSHRIHWLYLLTALCLAIIIYFLRKPHSEDGKRLGLLEYLFPKSIYLHKSAILDYFYFYFNTLIQILFIFPLFVGTTMAAAHFSKDILNSSFSSSGVITGDHIGVMIIFTVLIALALDLGVFIAHYMQHKISFLWEFHKTHHSAAVLTPMTVYRVHPVDNILSIGISGVLIGLTNGVYQYLSADSGVIFNILGINAVVLIFYLAAYNLRHSHIWLSYGRHISQWFVSPAMHQIHHSTAKHHLDKNLGLMFSFWDRIAGTLYIPRKQEKIQFGINPAEQKEFKDVINLYIVPLIQLSKHIRNWRPMHWKKTAAVTLFVTMLVPALWFNTVYTAPLPEIFRQVYLEDMTWQEVRQSLIQGNTTVIIPTGGTEQNGPHMILGKHNYIVAYTAGRIAERLGNTLVAPVMRYVPEGEINPKDNHMRFSGTLSIPQSVFEAVLESTARSLSAHGFKFICFLGDSAGNQAAQKNVAEKLNKEWAGSGVHVLHVSNYYYKNGQIQYLLNQGNNLKEIGNHAGIRDTSELMAVKPTGIRKQLLGDNRQGNYWHVGANGISAWANNKTGQRLLQMKITAGQSQIKRFIEQAVQN